MFKGKRGDNTLLYFRIICVIIAVGAFLIILGFVMDSVKDTLLEKNYRARDMALLITTLYASPGGVNYTYSLDEKDKNFVIKIGDGEVSVKDENGEVAYPYSRPEKLEDVKLEGSPEGLIEIKPIPEGIRKIIFKKGASGIGIEVSK